MHLYLIMCIEEPTVASRCNDVEQDFFFELLSIRVYDYQ